MRDFVAKWSDLLPNVELPQGYPPQRVFVNLDLDKNRVLDPSEMKNLRADVSRMLAAANSTGDRKGKPAPTTEQREAMKKAAMERSAKAKGGGIKTPATLLLAPGYCPRALTSRAAGPCSIGVSDDEIDKTQFFKRAAQRSPGEDPHAVFAKVDKDKSGGLSREEMREYYKNTAKAGNDMVKNRQEERKKNPWANRPKDAASHEVPFAVCNVSSSWRAHCLMLCLSLAVLYSTRLALQEFEHRYQSALRTESEPHGDFIPTSPQQL
jgi:hypothetical protein